MSSAKRRPLVQMELFEAHRHCILCGDVAVDRDKRLCGVWLAQKTTPCPVCAAVGDEPCKTGAGHELGWHHADRGQS